MSNNNTMAANLIATRGNRATAVILSWMEENAYEYLPKEVQRELRQTVLDQINVFKDLAIDIVKSDTAYLNQIWVEKLDQILDEVKSGSD